MLEFEKTKYSKVDFFKNPEEQSLPSNYFKTFTNHFGITFFICFSLIIFNQQSKETTTIQPVAKISTTQSTQVSQPSPSLVKNVQALQHLNNILAITTKELEELNLYQKNLKDLATEQSKLDPSFNQKETTQTIAKNELLIQNLKNNILEINKSIKIVKEYTPK